MRYGKRTDTEEMPKLKPAPESRLRKVVIVVVMLAIIVVCALSMFGCNDERAQAAADAREGISAASGHADDTGKAILIGVDARLPAASGVPSSQWPKPKMPAVEIERAPPKYVESAPPEPKGWWMEILTVGTAVGLPLLYMVGRLAPMVPGLGPIAGGIANLAWTALAHRDQKKADAAKDAVADNAALLSVIVNEAKGYPGIGSKIPPELVEALGILVKPKPS